VRPAFIVSEIGEALVDRLKSNENTFMISIQPSMAEMVAAELDYQELV
jgi:hypothetical protein